MARQWQQIGGSGGGGDFAEGDDFLLDGDGNPMKWNLDLLNLGCACRDKFAGGDENVGIRADVAGDFDLWNYNPIQVDNTNSQYSNFQKYPAIGGTAVLVCNFVYYVRTSIAGITITPKPVYAASRGVLISGPTAASVTGQTACTATSALYDGTDQIQVVSIALPSGFKYFKPMITIGGAVAAGEQVWARALFNLYVQS